MSPNEIVAALIDIVGPDNASHTNADRELHGEDQSSHPASLPDAVVWPATTEQVSQIAAFANANAIPIVGWGAGSSLEGNPIPIHGGIVVSFKRMNAILDIHHQDFQATVQPGIFYKDMNKTLARHGLFFAPDPGANASIGGMVANNAAGTRTVKYGATRDNVLALEVVLANGEIIRTGSRSVKQSAGYDLTHLFTGSEGTLGLVTEVTIKLAPLPEHFSAVLATFDSTNAAAEAVYGIIGSGLNPAALELLDANTMEYFNSEEDVKLPVAPTLLMEYHGASDTSLHEEMKLAEEICRDSGANTFEAGVGRKERDRLWHGRHKLGEVLFRAHPELEYLILDVAVPISAYPELATYAAEQLEVANAPGAIFGHAGDGNLHSTVYYDPNSTESYETVKQFNDRVVEKAIALDGTCTGEHGVGIGKRKYMVHEHGESAIGFMRLLKQTIDPNNIMNPGKLF